MVIRYADILRLFAEVTVNSDYLNMVRERVSCRCRKILSTKSLPDLLPPLVSRRQHRCLLVQEKKLVIIILS